MIDIDSISFYFGLKVIKQNKKQKTIIASQLVYIKKKNWKFFLNQVNLFKIQIIESI